MTISDFLEFRRRLGIFFLHASVRNSHLSRRGVSHHKICLSHSTQCARALLNSQLSFKNVLSTHENDRPPRSIRPLHYRLWFYTAMWESWGVLILSPSESCFYCRNSWPIERKFIFKRLKNVYKTEKYLKSNKVLSFEAMEQHWTGSTSIPHCFSSTPSNRNEPSTVILDYYPLACLPYTRWRITPNNCNSVEEEEEEANAHSNASNFKMLARLDMLTHLYALFQHNSELTNSHQNSHTCLKEP